MSNPFATAEGKRIELTNQQVKQIRDLYKDVRHEFQDRIRVLGNKTNISSQMRTQYLKDFSKDLSADINYLNKQLESTIKDNALKVATAVVEDSEKLARDMGFDGIFTSHYYIPHQAVESIITGQLYDGKWTLSKAIWSDNQRKLNDINEIVSKGLIANKSTYDIAKDLERYVNPQARKDWNWSKVYPNTLRKVDYNAQRLARTMLSHAYQESFVRSTRDNPFIESYRWLASGGDRMCPICEERDGKIFEKDDLPLDHPNGMCTFEVVIEKSYDEIARDLRNWVDGTGDEELNDRLDYYAENLGYSVQAFTSMNPKVKNAVSIPVKSQSKSVPTPPTLSNYDKAYKEFSEKRALEISDLAPFNQMDETLNKLVENNEFRIRFPSDDSTVIKSILNDGRFKTQFETKVSGGQYSPEIRKKASENLFNTPSNIALKDYEKYGYLGSKNIAKDWNPQLGFYGDGIATLKKETMFDRTTITVGDSLRDAVDGRYIMGSKLTNIDSKVCVGRPSMIDEFNDRISKGLENKGIDDASYLGYKVRSYFELQYHGDVELKDIDSITIDKYILDEIKRDESLAKIAKESGIKFNYLDGDSIIGFDF